jgi:hypothetical protein
MNAPPLYDIKEPAALVGDQMIDVVFAVYVTKPPLYEPPMLSSVHVFPPSVDVAIWPAELPMRTSESGFCPAKSRSDTVPQTGTCSVGGGASRLLCTQPPTSPTLWGGVSDWRLPAEEGRTQRRGGHPAAGR